MEHISIFKKMDLKNVQHGWTMEMVFLSMILMEMAKLIMQENCSEIERCWKMVRMLKMAMKQ